MERIEKLRREVGRSAKKKGASLVGDGLGESGRLDRAVLDRQIQEILQEASLNPVSAAAMADQLDAFVACAHRGDIPAAAAHVAALLSVPVVITAALTRARYPGTVAVQVEEVAGS